MLLEWRLLPSTVLLCRVMLSYVFVKIRIIRCFILLVRAKILHLENERVLYMFLMKMILVFYQRSSEGFLLILSLTLLNLLWKIGIIILWSTLDQLIHK